MDFDRLVRGRMLGMNSGHMLHRKVSCNEFVPEINTPLFLLYAKDDAITDFNFVPLEDLARNRNIITAVIPKGGHCDLFYPGK